MSFRLSIRGKGTTSISKDQSKVFLGYKTRGKGTLKVIPGGPAGVVSNSSLCQKLCDRLTKRYKMYFPIKNGFAFLKKWLRFFEKMASLS